MTQKQMIKALQKELRWALMQIRAVGGSLSGDYKKELLKIGVKI